jgi:DNA-damage-inducible protein J
MAKTATVRARVEPHLKEEAEEVLEELGLNPTAAITLYYEQIVKRHGIPFEVSLPNETTLAAMRDAESGRGVTRARNVDDFFAKLNADD